MLSPLLLHLVSKYTHIRWFRWHCLVLSANCLNWKICSFMEVVDGVRMGMNHLIIWLPPVIFFFFFCCHHTYRDDHHVSGGQCCSWSTTTTSSCGPPCGSPLKTSLTLWITSNCCLIPFQQNNNGIFFEKILLWSWKSFVLHFTWIFLKFLAAEFHHRWLFTIISRMCSRED